MEKIKFCDDCKRKNCQKRIKGGICALKEKVGELCRSLDTRDPVLIAHEMARIIDSESQRYQKAVQNEKVGEKSVITFVDNNGNIKEVTKTNKLDSKISALALNIIKEGKIVNEIINPQKNPLFQQNNQYNVSLGSAEQIKALPEKEREQVLKFIDKKLDDERKDD